MTKDEDSNIQYYDNNNEVYGKYQHVYSLGDYKLALPSEKRDELFLILHTSPINNHQEYRVFQAKPQELLNLAKEILREIDPTPEDKILETLKRIEKILEHQHASH